MAHSAKCLEEEVWPYDEHLSSPENDSRHRRTYSHTPAPAKEIVQHEEGREILDVGAERERRAR